MFVEMRFFALLVIVAVVGRRLFDSLLPWTYLPWVSNSSAIRFIYIGARGYLTEYMLRCATGLIC